ncbi:steroid 17-alpha-hydroxylase/17,20 lyase-like [Rhipicephalus sanguineus]|uniref:steroid 17-alpha-hydroxylase/17,20 lyase-like n=1 Tax=Rhipicephalus sanguineus TaxID=34632 RepID=UPI0018937C17|nr:steroid 17-alpha-hydroxylase/17,20 lyase-like [Rhipicephalus sanguineus]
MGVTLQEENKEIRRMKEINHEFFEVSPNGLPSDIASWLAILYRKQEQKAEALMCEFRDIVHSRLFTKAQQSYVPGKTGNFTHAMLAAQEESLREKKGYAEYLTKGNMIQIILNLVTGHRFGNSSKCINVTTISSYSNSGYGMCREDDIFKDGEAYNRLSDCLQLHEEKNDIERLENINHRFYEISPNGLPSDIAPILAILYLKREKKMAAVFRELGEILHRLFSKAEATYIPGNIENFTHAMLAAREEAIKEDKADAPYLTKASMILATVNLFNAGSNTSTGTLQWLLLRTAKEQRLQERIKKEIEDNIGSVPPVYGDREKLPFTVACLLETLRMHPATPLGIPHNTTTDTRVGKWNIPKDTGMMYNIHAVHHDPKNWENPEEFRPERFLDPVTGKVCTDVGPLITFGQGARSCPGEKLAQMDMFYIFVRLMQRVTVSVPSGSSDVNWNGKGSSLFLHPARQNIVYTRIS